MVREIASINDLEKYFSNSIAKIRDRFPDSLNYQYSMTNPIAHSLSLSISEQAGIKVDGYLSNKDIVINSDITYLERKNFSLFHEISHYLISSNDEIISFLMQFHAGKEKKYQQYIEALCNMGAGEFLAPINQIKEVIKGENFSITLIKKLDLIFPASKPAIIFQLARAASHKCTFVIIDHGFISQSYDRQFDKLLNIPVSGAHYYILYSATSKRNKYRPARYTLIPKHHLLRNAFEEQSFIRGRDFIPYKNGNQKHICDCEAMYYQRRDFGLFNLEKPTDDYLQYGLF